MMMTSPTAVQPVDLLLVEDHPSDAELTLRALRALDLGTDIYHLENGAEALNFIFGRDGYDDRSVDEAPDLILLDLKLPKVGGHEVLRALRESRARLTRIIDSAIDAIISIDADLENPLFNTAAEEIFGARPRRPNARRSTRS